MIASRNCASTVAVLLLLSLAPVQAFLCAKDTDTAPAASTTATPDAPAAGIQERISKLIKQLGDSQYLVRQAAQDELFRIGPEAFDALTAAAGHDDIEIAARANYLLRQIRIESDSDSEQVKAILRSYGLMDDEGRYAKARKLATLVRGEGLAPLCRLVRFEKSPLLSKQCALLVLGQTTANSDERAERAKVIESVLARSNRPGARWLRAYLRLETEPEAVFAEWEKFLEDEIAAVRGSAKDSSTDIVVALGRYEVDWLQASNRNERAIDVMRRMISTENGDPQRLVELSEWLLQMNALEVQDELITRFKGAFKADPTLCYFMAETRRLAGKTDEAEKIAEDAAKLVPQNQHETRTRLAIGLQLRGLFDWSEREYRRVIAAVPPDDERGIAARVNCAELLHDLLREKEAADMLKVLADAIAADPNVATKLTEVTPRDAKFVRTRMNYCYAMHYETLKDSAQQWKHLEAALKEDPFDADILIAMYRASAEDPKRRAQAKECIERATVQLRQRINSSPDDSTSYNEYAWLVGNTEGDMDLAIEYSQKSIDLIVAYRRDSDYDERPSLWPEPVDREPAAYVDTLAHCYAGKGDYENAVKHQAHAAKLEPHSMAIVRALDEFKAALAKKAKN